MGDVTKIERKVVVGAVDFTTGAYHSLDLADYRKSEWSTAFISSASLPGIFPPVHLRDMHLMDGGTVWNIDLIGAFEKCHELGVIDQKNIIVDVFMLIPNHVKDVDKN